MLIMTEVYGSHRHASCQVTTGHASTMTLQAVKLITSGRVSKGVTGRSAVSEAGTKRQDGVTSLWEHKAQVVVPLWLVHRGLLLTL